MSGENEEMKKKNAKSENFVVHDFEFFSQVDFDFDSDYGSDCGFDYGAVSKMMMMMMMKNDCGCGY